MKPRAIYGPLKIRFWVVALIIAGPCVSYAQMRPMYSQYMFNPLVINPAYAGADDALSMTVAARSQWTGIDGAPETFTFSAHMPFPRKRLGVGLFGISDRIGVHKNLSLQAVAAYHLRVGQETSLSFGIQGGLRNVRADYLSLDGNASGDPRIPAAAFSENHFDIGAGLFLKGKNIQAGVSVPGFIPAKWMPNDSTTVNPMVQTVHVFSRYTIRLNDALDFVPSVFVMFSKDISPMIHLNGGVLIYDVLFTGVSWRKDESLGVLLRAGVTPQLNVGYSYDFVTGSLAQVTGASHEITINYLFRFSRHKISSPR